MKVFIIHGQSHQGTNYNLAHMVLNNIEYDEYDEFFIPDDMPDPCIGCNKCFFEGEDKCPSRDKVKVIAESLESADLIILASPTYCCGMPGHLKQLFDHLGYMWIAHRPRPQMFEKPAIVISTAAGWGSDEGGKDIVKQLNWLGIKEVYEFFGNIGCWTWDELSNNPELHNKVIDEVNNLINSYSDRSLKDQFHPLVDNMFEMMKGIHSGSSISSIDKEYWERYYLQQ